MLDGNAKRRADALGITRVLITFTHEKTNAVAFAVAVGDVKPVLTPARGGRRSTGRPRRAAARRAS